MEGRFPTETSPGATGLAEAGLRALRAYLRYRTDFRRLRALDDRMLEDVGLNRFDLPPGF